MDDDCFAWLYLFSANINRRIFAISAPVEVHTARATVPIHLPVETWAEVLSFCDRKSLKEGVSLSRRLFHAIARPLLDGPKGRILPEMEFEKEGGSAILLKLNDNSADEYYRPKALPTAEVALPRTVAGFSSIKVIHFDANVISFLFAIRLLLNDVWLEVDYASDPNNLATLECLLRVFPRLERAVTSLCVNSEKIVFSAELLARLLSNVRRLRLECKPCRPSAESLSLISATGCCSGTCSRNCSPHIPVLVEWLNEPLEDGAPKMASLNIGNITNVMALIAQAQQRFLCATNSAPYFVAFYSAKFRGAPSVKLPFATLRNEHSGEVLSLGYYSQLREFDGYEHNFVPFRRRSCGASTDEESEEAEEMLQMWAAFEQALFSNEKRNKLVLNVTGMSQIDETFFAIDSTAEDDPQDGTGD